MPDAFFPPERPVKGAQVDKCRWMQHFYDFVVNALQFHGDDKFIAIDKTQGGNIIKFNPAALALPRSSAPAGGNNSAGYNGPFKVEIDGANNCLRCYNSSYPADSPVYAGYYRHGYTSYPVMPNLNIPFCPCVVLRIKWNNADESYGFDFLPGAGGGDPSLGYIYVPIAMCNYNQGIVSSVTQLQFGDVLTPGVL